jgi:MFS superfamily sulfate permease-like transporter
MQQYTPPPLDLHNKHSVFPEFDFFLTLTTVIIGVCYGVEVGIIAGGLLNLLILLKVWTRPRVTTEIRMVRFADFSRISLDISIVGPPRKRLHLRQTGSGTLLRRHRSSDHQDNSSVQLHERPPDCSRPPSTVPASSKSTTRPVR